MSGKPINRVLVPVDFSHHANSAMRMALAVANRFGATIQVIHVDALPGVGTIAVEPVYIAPQLFEGLHAEHDAKIEQNLREIGQELQAGAAPGVAVETSLRRGPTVERIVEVAGEWQADLIVMGSQGVSGVAQLVLGSTAEKVSRIAPCPVLIGGRADDTGDHERVLRRVIAAIDYSDIAPAVAHMAATMVEPGGTLELMHVWHAPFISALNVTLGGGRQDVGSMIEQGQRAQVEMIEAFARDLVISNIDITTYIGVGMPAPAILVRAEEIRADLIVLGSHSRSGVGERLLGTVADRVLRYAQVPVLLFPRTAAGLEE